MKVKCQAPQAGLLALGTARYVWGARALGTGAGCGGGARCPGGPQVAGSWRRDVELPSISRQSLPAMLFPASTPEPAAPSWPGWLLCAGGVGAGVGEAAGA